MKTKTEKREEQEKEKEKTLMLDFVITGPGLPTASFALLLIFQGPLASLGRTQTGLVHPPRRRPVQLEGSDLPHRIRGHLDGTCENADGLCDRGGMRDVEKEPPRASKGIWMSIVIYMEVIIINMTTEYSYRRSTNLAGYTSQ